jgi:hypothetical protein
MLRKYLNTSGGNRTIIFIGTITAHRTKPPYNKSPAAGVTENVTSSKPDDTGQQFFYSCRILTAFKMIKQTSKSYFYLKLSITSVQKN